MAIRAEINENQHLVARAGQYHSVLEKAFRTAAEEEAALPDLSIADRGLLAPAPIMKTAWESAQDVGLPNKISYEQLLSLAQLYEQQEQYRQINQVLSMQIYSALMDHGLDELLGAYRRMIPLLHDSAVREEELENAYKQVLDNFPQQRRKG